MEYIGEDVLVVEDADIRNGVGEIILKSGPRGLFYSMSIVIHKTRDGEIKVLKNRWGNLMSSALPKDILEYVSMNNEERRIMSRGW